MTVKPVVAKASCGRHHDPWPARHPATETRKGAFGVTQQRVDPVTTPNSSSDGLLPVVAAARSASLAARDMGPHRARAEPTPTGAVMASGRPSAVGPGRKALLMSPASIARLLARQSLLQAEARALLADLDLAAQLADVGPPLVTGSFVSGLMCWRELDVMLLVGSHFSPQDVLRLLQRVAERVTSLRYSDERGPRCSTGHVRDERYHVILTVDRAGYSWQVDLSLWLHDLHQNVTRWHEELRETITAEQRTAVLRIKDAWHLRPCYPDQVGGLDIYTAVIDHGVRSPRQFATWLAQRELPSTRQRTGSASERT
jgi:hypothetical protein